VTDPLPNDERTFDRYPAARCRHVPICFAPCRGHTKRGNRIERSPHPGSDVQPLVVVGPFLGDRYELGPPKVDSTGQRNTLINEVMREYR